jgi:hypothetical protein
VKLFTLGLILVGCGTVKETPDAAVNGDGMLIDTAMPGNCANNGYDFTGEHLDWDSHDEGALFCGVGSAIWQVRGSTDAKEMTSTGPNGRAEIKCLPPDDHVVVDITVPSGPNQCTTSPGSYAVNGIAYINKALVAMLPTMTNFRARSISTTRLTNFYSQIGPAYDATKGALLVHLVGAPQVVSISAAHDQAEFFDDNLWQAQSTTAGSTVEEVFFPNVAPGTTAVTSSLSGTVGLDPAVPIEANKITYVTIYHP